MNVYHIWVDTTAIPLTVIAANYEWAERLYSEWRRAHDLGNEYELLQVAVKDAAWLSDHPQLAQLAATGRSGIAYWVDHRLDWVLAAPSEKPAGLLEPPPSPVTYYLVEIDGGSRFRVFATNLEHARSTYLAMHCRVYFNRPHRFAINTPSRWLLTGEMAVLREDMDAGRVGIAARTEEEGWHIFPPTDERVVP